MAVGDASGRKIEEIRLTRHQVARKELDVAITLLLTGGEPVAINLLAWAAVDVLRGLCEARGEVSFLALFEDHIRPEYHREWRRTLKDHHNFLKHSSKDPERVVEDFRPEAATYPLVVASQDYEKLFETMTFPMHVFRAWFMARNPKIMKPRMAALFEQARPMIGDISTMGFDRSLQSAGDALRIFQERPTEIHAQFDALGRTIEW
jgi:hypothetical protein